MSKYLSRISFLFLICIHCLVTVVPSFAQQQMGAPVRLFNGHDLDGWVKGNGQPVDKGWSVENGILTRSSAGGDIFTTVDFENYALSFEWKIATGGNSGIKYRVKKYGNAWLGCEYQILDDQDRPHHKHSTGSLYDVIPPSTNKRSITPETWNTSLVVVNRNSIVHWLNGQKIVDVDTANENWQQSVQASKFKDRAGFGENPVGKIMLQDHGHQVWFRNIVLTPIEQVETVGTHASGSSTAVWDGQVPINGGNAGQCCSQSCCGNRMNTSFGYVRPCFRPIRSIRFGR